MPRRQLRHLLPSWTLTLVVAFSVCMLLRDQVLEAYPVPTPSMEPTIEGDERFGDKVLVDKTFDNRARPDRFDTIVFRLPGDARDRIVVKRVAALPNECVLIRNYDLWVGSEEHGLRQVRKDPVEHDDMLATVWDSARCKGSFASNGWRRERARVHGSPAHIELDGSETTVRDLFPDERFAGRAFRHQAWRAAWNLTWNGIVTTGYLDAFDRLHEGVAAFDFGARLRVRATPRTHLWIDLRYGRSSFAVRYDGAGEASIWRDGEPIATDGAAGKAPALAEERHVELMFLYLDGVFHVVADRKRIASAEVEFAELKEPAKQARSTNGIAVAAAGGKATVEHLALVHDFHYVDLGANATYEVYRVPNDHYFVLGDNSQHSRDSRQYGSIPVENLIGRPLAIAAPWKRRRLIRR